MFKTLVAIMAVSSQPSEEYKCHYSIREVSGTNVRVLEIKDTPRFGRSRVVFFATSDSLGKLIQTCVAYKRGTRPQR